MASTSFVPKGQKGLLLRSPLTVDFSPSGHQPRPIYSKHFDQTESLSKQDQDVLLAGGTPQKIGFFTRNNPHPGRVRHMKGLNNIPICYVEDQIQHRMLLSAPSGQDLGPGYIPLGNTRFSANHRGKGLNAVGIVPVTYAWRDELEKKTQNALHRAMGNIPPPSRASLMSRSSQRGQASQFDALHDDQILDMLCRILQTDSVPACQAWLSSASETEKNIVLNMIRMAATGELEGMKAPQQRASNKDDFRYIWAPGNSQTDQAADYCSYLQCDDDFDFDTMQYGGRRLGGEVAGLHDSESPTDPFRFPEHDTVIKTARQLSSLASRQSSRAERMHYNQTIGDTGLLQRNAHYDSRSGSRQHPRSLSLSGPVPTGNIKSTASRSRSRSANAKVGQKDTDQFPPPPVRVSVSKDNIQVGKPGSARVKLRYTSHWD